MAADPATGAALVAVDQFTDECDLGFKQGLFYAFTDGGWQSFTPAGQPAKLPEALNGEPLVSAGGQNWAWLDQNSGELQASIGGAPAQRVYAGEVRLPAWSPDGHSLLFFEDGRLYRAGAPDLKPEAQSDQKTLADYDVSEWAEE